MSKSPSLRRIQADVRELALDPSDRYHASPLENDMFEWHFTIRGAKGTDFEGGVYHGRILLPPDYPFKPPHIMFLTPSGRFETNTKICLSFTAYHQELWQPAWGIRLILEALISFLPTPADGAIGALDWSSKERKRLAAKSVQWECPTCGKIADLLPKEKEGKDGSAEGGKNEKPNRFQKEIEELQRLQMMEHTKKDDDEKEESKEKTNDEQQGVTVQEDENGPATAATEDTPRLAAESSPEENVEKNQVHAQETEDEEAKPSEDEIPEVSESPLPGQNMENNNVNQNVPTPATSAAAETNELGGVNQAEASTSGLLDPLLQAIIVILSIICYLFVRKIQALLDDIRALE